MHPCQDRTKDAEMLLLIGHEESVESHWMITEYKTALIPNKENRIGAKYAMHRKFPRQIPSPLRYLQDSRAHNL